MHRTQEALLSCWSCSVHSFVSFVCEFSLRVHISHTDTSRDDWLYSVLNGTSIAWEARVVLLRWIIFYEGSPLRSRCGCLNNRKANVGGHGECDCFRWSALSARGQGVLIARK